MGRVSQSVPSRGSGWVFGIFDCRLLIFELPLKKRTIKNRNSKIANILTHPLPRDGTDWDTPKRTLGDRRESQTKMSSGSTPSWPTAPEIEVFSRWTLPESEQQLHFVRRHWFRLLRGWTHCYLGSPRFHSSRRSTSRPELSVHPWWFQRKSSESWR